MTKKLLLIIILVFQAYGMYAQRPTRDRIKTLKVAFITERLGLTSDEAQSFWPIYNAHERALETIRKKERLELKSKTPLSQDLSPAESSKILNEYLAIQNEKHVLEQQFIEKLKNTLSSKKILLLLKAEEDFKKRLLQQYRRRR